MQPEDRADLLSASERRTVSIHENRRNLAWFAGDDDHRRRVLKTQTRSNAKHNPARFTTG
jgi:hypothetical protein